MDEYIWVSFGFFVGVMVGSLLGAQLSWSMSRANPKKRQKLEELEQVWFEHTVGKPDDLP